MKIGILISGRGSNMVALVEAVKSGEIPHSEVALVISDQKNVAGIEKARNLGIETLIIERMGRKRAAHDAEILAALKAQNVELICLAGYMRLLSPEFIEAFPQRILNIHPSLLPSFKGLEAQKQAIEYGVKFSGCTVHLVDENLDNGAIVAQKVVEVKDDDMPETLSERILQFEHALYVESVAKIVQGNYRIIGRRVIFEENRRPSNEIS